MENPLPTSSPHRIGFYPCCDGDIEEPRRFLAPFVDEIRFCDLKRAKIWDGIRTEEPALPSATFMQADVNEAIEGLPLLTALFYRSDGNAEGGSGLPIVGEELLPRILGRFAPEGGWIFSDGSNGGRYFRKLLSEDWLAKPSLGWKFRRRDGFDLKQKHGKPVHAIELRPMEILPPTMRKGWVPPRDVRFSSFDELLALCCCNHRLVPIPEKWNALYGMLQNTRQSASGGWEPPLPLILAAWHRSTRTEKLERFKEHLRWAEAQGQLEQIGAYLSSLPENQWCHFEEV